jgi:hypothetical protein
MNISYRALLYKILGDDLESPFATSLAAGSPNIGNQ